MKNNIIIDIDPEDWAKAFRVSDRYIITEMEPANF